MFRGDSPALRQVTCGAVGVARELGQDRVGAEHLVLSLATYVEAIAVILRDQGLDLEVLTEFATAVGDGGVAAAADRSLLSGIGVDLDGVDCSVFDIEPRRELLFPLGATAARRRNGHGQPLFGLDYRAGYEASLRLALARRERDHRPEHLALALAILDSGVRWMVSTLGADPTTIVSRLSEAFPSPARNHVLRIERRLGESSRARAIRVRYQRRTGHPVSPGGLRLALGR